LVSASLARRLFADESAIGKRVRRVTPSGADFQDQPDYTIAGVVADVRETSLRADPPDMIYVPALDPRVDPRWVPTDMSLVVRTRGSTDGLAASVRSAILEVAP